VIKNFVLDTNVLLHDPNALFHFEDNRVIVPITVIEELDHFKKDLNMLGRNARTVSKHIDRLRASGNLGEGVALEHGGVLRVALGSEGASLLPPELEGRAGDNAGILLRSVKKEDVERGQVLAKPGSVTPHAEFEGEVYILTKEEGGRHTPFFTGYKPQFYIRTTDVTGDVSLPEGTEMIMPGDTVNLKIKLMSPVALEEKQRFAIREGGKTVGAGVVTKIVK